MTTPDAAPTQELQFRLHVDAAHCDRAAQGLRTMAIHQYRSQVRRFEAIGWFERMRAVLVKLSPAIAVLLLVLAVVAGSLGAMQRTSRGVLFGLTVLLLLEAIVFVLITLRFQGTNTWVRTRFETWFGNRALAHMRKARQAAPFEAVYDLRGELLAYSRVKDGQWTLRWHRQLGKYRARGVCLRTPGLLVVFPKPGSVVPVVLVLTADDDTVAPAFRAQGWTIVDIDPATCEPVPPDTPA